MLLHETAQRNDLSSSSKVSCVLVSVKCYKDLFGGGEFPGTFLLMLTLRYFTCSQCPVVEDQSVLGRVRTSYYYY